jgi:hypothetical protein
MPKKLKIILNKDEIYSFAYCSNMGYTCLVVQVDQCESTLCFDKINFFSVSFSIRKKKKKKKKRKRYAYSSTTVLPSTSDKSE